MNGIADYLVDTNILIYYLNGDETVIDWIQEHKNNISISIIASLEVLSYPYTIEEDIIVRRFLNAFHLFELDQVVFEKTIQLRRDYKIKLPDAIIAATAKAYNLTLVTRNIPDFSKIKIEIFDPFNSTD